MTDIEERDMSGEIELDKDFKLKKELRCVTLLYRRDKIGKESGEPTFDYVPRYYPDMQSAIQAYLDSQIKKASSVEEIKTIIDKSMARIEEIFKDVPSCLAELRMSKEGVQD